MGLFRDAVRLGLALRQKVTAAFSHPCHVDRAAVDDLGIVVVKMVRRTTRKVE